MGCLTAIVPELLILQFDHWRAASAILILNLHTCADHACSVVSLKAALPVLRGASIEDSDVFIRAAEISSSPWRVQKNDLEPRFEPRVKSGRVGRKCSGPI